MIKEIKKIKKVKRVGDDSIILKETVDDDSVDSELQDAIEKATVPLDFDAVNDTKDQILFNGLEGRMLLVKVGVDGQDIDEKRLERIEGDLSNLIENFGIKCLLYVTTSDVDIKVIG
jgi:hypothetical protein